jgi:uncharacterized membrane protein
MTEPWTEPWTEAWLVIAGLAVATFAIRLSGALLGQRIPNVGGWARALDALPGCLLVSLVSVALLSGGPKEWIAAAVAIAVAIVTRNLPLTMAAGIASIWALRTFA